MLKGLLKGENKATDSHIVCSAMKDTLEVSFIQKINLQLWKLLNWFKFGQGCEGSFWKMDERGSKKKQ